MSEQFGEAQTTLRETQARLRASIARARRIVARTRFLLGGGEPRGHGPRGDTVPG